jgi:hypothetical protein
MQTFGYQPYFVLHVSDMRSSVRDDAPRPSRPFGPQRRRATSPGCAAKVGRCGNQQGQRCGRHVPMIPHPIYHIDRARNEPPRQGAKDVKNRTLSWRPWRSWRFEVLLASGGFNPFVAQGARPSARRQEPADGVATGRGARPGERLAQGGARPGGHQRGPRPRRRASWPCSTAGPWDRRRDHPARRGHVIGSQRMPVRSRCHAPGAAAQWERAAQVLGDLVEKRRATAPRRSRLEAARAGGAEADGTADGGGGKLASSLRAAWEAAERGTRAVPSPRPGDRHARCSKEGAFWIVRKPVDDFA